MSNSRHQFNYTLQVLVDAVITHLDAFTDEQLDKMSALCASELEDRDRLKFEALEEHVCASGLCPQSPFDGESQ